MKKFSRMSTFEDRFLTLRIGIREITSCLWNGLVFIGVTLELFHLAI